MKNHALIVGGTGMLRSVVAELAGQFDVVSVIARSEERLNALVEQVRSGGGNCNPVAVDYADSEALSTSLARALANTGSVDLAISWIHSSAPEAHRVVAGCVNDQADGVCRWFDVLGSAFADPSARVQDREAEFREFPSLLYRSVVLGFIVEPDGSRWLTHEEIREGVLRAIATDDYRSVTGRVRPWHRRP